MRRIGDLAIDLGTANTLVFEEGRGIVFDEPTVVAMDARTGEVLSVGEEAWETIGRTPSRVVAVRPLRRGAITDYEVTRQLIRMIFRRVGVSRLSRPRTLVCVPSAVTEVERRAVRDATTSAGARSVSLIEEPMAAAIGAGLPVHEPLGNMVVDVGGGTSEVAMVSMGGIISSRSVRIGGFDMDEVIQRHIRKRYGLAIGERAAERLKIAAGSAFPVIGTPPARVQGREIQSGMPKAVEVRPEELREALNDPVATIVTAVKACLSESDPELGHDILERGMFVAGGGALLCGLDTRLAHECEVPVHLTDRPLQMVVLGAGKCLELLHQTSGVFAASPWLR